MIKLVELDRIKADASAQPRVAMQTEVIEEYSDAIADGVVFPPIIVFFDGNDYFLADGFHRFYAAKGLGIVDFECDVRQGGLRDAVLFSVGANSSHGLRRTNEDKRRAVLTLLNDEEWGKWSGNEIARRAAVSPDTVSRLKASILSDSDSMDRTFIHPKTGQPTTMDTSNIGRGSRDPYLKDDVREDERPALIEGPITEDAVLEAAAKIRQERARANREQVERIISKPVELPDGKFETIVIDPPWDMQKIERDVRPNQVGFDYPTMSEEDLTAFGETINRMAADDCHMFMWTTQKFVPMSLRLLERWGFRYVLHMVWHKPGGFQPIGLPQYNCEFAVYARKGAPAFIDTKAFNCCFEAPRREHSRKPDEFYDLIRRVTREPRIDVFSREKRDGFAQFGNEVEKFGEAA